MKEDEITGHVACNGEMRNVYGILVRKSQRTSSRRTHASRRENNIKMDLRDTDCVKIWTGLD